MNTMVVAHADRHVIAASALFIALAVFLVAILSELEPDRRARHRASWPRSASAFARSKSRPGTSSNRGDEAERRTLTSIRDGLIVVDANLGAVIAATFSGRRGADGRARMFPPLVFTIWMIGLVLTLLVFVPLAVVLLHRLWRAARSIQLYAREALVGGGRHRRQHGADRGARRHDRGGIADAVDGRRRSNRSWAPSPAMLGAPRAKGDSACCSPSHSSPSLSSWWHSPDT